MYKVKGLSINVYRAAGWDDCSLNGVSARYDRLILIGDGIEGPVTVDMDNPPENVVTLVKRRLFGSEPYFHLEPLDGCHAGGNKWYMAGGNLGYTSDSRFPSRYPLSIHDRHES